MPRTVPNAWRERHERTDRETESTNWWLLEKPRLLEKHLELPMVEKCAGHGGRIVVSFSTSPWQRPPPYCKGNGDNMTATRKNTQTDNSQTATRPLPLQGAGAFLEACHTHVPGVLWAFPVKNKILAWQNCGLFYVNRSHTFYKKYQTTYILFQKKQL